MRRRYLSPSCRGWRCPGIRTVAGDLVADDDIVVENFAGSSCEMRVEGHSGQAIVHQLIVDHHVSGYRGARQKAKYADSRARSGDLITIVQRRVIGNGVVNDAQSHS